MVGKNAATNQIVHLAAQMELLDTHLRELSQIILINNHSVQNYPIRYSSSGRLGYSFTSDIFCAELVYFRQIRETRRRYSKEF